MKASIEITTGKLIEAQSDSDVITLHDNAVAMGYRPEDVEVREITKDQLDILVAASNKGT